MLISNETQAQLNKLLGVFFAANSEADNIAYNLADSCYPEISSIYHKSFAHIFTGDVFADKLSDLMDLLDSRSIREIVPENKKDYNGNVEEMFKDNLYLCERVRNEIIKSIELAELNSDIEIKIELETMLTNFMPYRKQAMVWYEYAKRYAGDEKSFNIHFECLTSYIKVV